MSELVDECRREWKRLGVPEAVAEEMAAELEADLEEARAEGVPATDVLGLDALHPRTFAASWALERGVIAPRSAASGGRGRRIALAGFVTLTALVMLGASFAILTSDSNSVPGVRALPTPPDGRRHVVRIVPAPEASGAWLVTPIEAALVDPPDDDLDAVGWLLLAVGLAGLFPAGLLWFSRGGGRGPIATA